MQITGRITKPKTGDRIDRIISVQGEVSGFSPGVHIWLVLQIKSGLLWLKDPEIKRRFWRIY